MLKRLMKACPAPANLLFPLYATPKIDGIRCATTPERALSCASKPLPNLYLQRQLAALGSACLDGEITVGDPVASDVFRTTTSAVMSISGEPQFTFHVFDIWAQPRMQYAARWELVKRLCSMLPSEYVSLVHPTLVTTAAELEEYETEMLAAGYEGVMLRSPFGFYKQGRSTASEAYLLKMKRFEDSEATIVGFTEGQSNDNEPELNERGLLARSSHQDGQIPSGELGSLVVQDLYTGVKFKLGTGFTAADRKEFWGRREDLLGLIVKYKYQKVGVKLLPRQPVWLGFRDQVDLL